MRKNSIKNTRVNEAVRQELSMLISREVKDPRVDMMTTVTKVIVATDLKTCKVYISVYGDEEKKAETMAGLKSSEGFLRRMLARNQDPWVVLIKYNGIYLVCLKARKKQEPYLVMTGNAISA